MVTKNGKKHFLLFLVLGILISGGLFTFQAIPPVDAVEQQQAIEDAKDEKKKTERELKAANGILKLKEKQSNVLAGQIATIETQAQKLEREIRENEQALDDLGRELRDTEAGISEKERFILRQKHVLSGLVREYHASTADGAEILFAFDVDDAGIPMKHDDWLAETGVRIGALLRSMEETKQALLANKETLDKKKTEVDTLQEQLAQRNDYLEGSKQSKATLLAKTEAEKQKYATLVKTLEEELKDLENEINNLESGKIGTLDLGKIPKYQKGLLRYPLNNITLTQRYGMTSYAKQGAYGGGPHNGIDFGGSYGSSILASDDGTVVAIGSMTKNGKWYGYGRWIAIDHGNGLLTLYGHLSKQSVKKGQKVKAGEKIGAMGNTGFVKPSPSKSCPYCGTHLHFSVFFSGSFEIVPSKSVSGISIPIGKHIDPSKYLP